MLERAQKSLILCVCVFPGGAQNCDVMVDITAADDAGRVRVDRTGRVCLRCLNANGVTSATTVWTLSDGSTIVDRENQNPAVGEYANGVLVLLPGVLGNGSAGEYGPLACTSIGLTPGYDFVVMRLYSSGEQKVKQADFNFY